MIGFRGASRYYSPRYREGFALECRAIKRLREEMGFDNVVVMIPFCRSVGEADKVLAVMKPRTGSRGKNGLEVYVMCEIPSNVVLAGEFAKRFDGFSIGSNDLTQLTLGVDRDSGELADLFDEQDMAVEWMIENVITAAHKAGAKIGLCGQAPSDHPEFAEFLVRCGIDTISVSPDSFIAVKRRGFRPRLELGVEGLHLPVGDRVVEAFEEIGRRLAARLVGKPQPILLAHHRHRALVGGIGEEVLQPDVEHHRDPSSVGSVGNSCPRSIFDSIAGDSPVCSPSCTSPSFFFRRSDRTFGPIR
jgi:hypothetical protein